jgi:hypothetical protein
VVVNAKISFLNWALHSKRIEVRSLPKPAIKREMICFVWEKKGADMCSQWRQRKLGEVVLLLLGHVWRWNGKYDDANPY